MPLGDEELDLVPDENTLATLAKTGRLEREDYPSGRAPLSLKIDPSEEPSHSGGAD
jgi:hypothetical protein